MRSRLILMLAAAGLVLVATTGAASAHGDEGELELTAFEQTGPTTVEIEVGIVYEGDGHLAEDATVTATLSGPDGATVGPVELAWAGENSSLYAATVDVPVVGDWTVAVTSTDPTGAVDGSLSIVEQAGATTTEATSTTAAPTTTEDAPEPVTLDDELAADEDAAVDGGVSPAVIVIACLVLAVLVIGGAFLVARSRGGRDAAGTGTDT
ncbi:MAG: hypothetical protein ACK4V6_11740 [Microthrixaceae bacterium]